MGIVLTELAKFQGLMRTLFDFDSYDLDFGIYRILRHKRREINDFLETRLPQIVDQSFREHGEADRVGLVRKLSDLSVDISRTLGPDAIDNGGNLRDDFHHVPVGKQYLLLQTQLKKYEVGDTTKTAVYSYLFTFFSRYYEDGDFISKRRYARKEPYVIPYSGEETLFYWANRDQYYAKSTARFGTYRFVLEEYAVIFELRIDRTSGDADRFVVPVVNDPVSYESSRKTVTVLFENRALTSAEKQQHGKTAKYKIQADLMGAAERLIIDTVNDIQLIARLSKPAIEQEISTLQHHLKRFVKRNSADFFIHKDLKLFLSGELEFFIKNEVLDFAALTEGNGNAGLQSARTIATVGRALIDLVSQVEDLQKTLFEKKKFVLATNYCVTLDKVPPEFWAEILSTRSQVDEWIELFGLTGDSGSPTIDEKFLEDHQNLVVDTAYFTDDFKSRLLDHFDDLDESINGIVLKSDSFQALNLILPTFKARTKCIYIAPPYNHGDDDFLFKDGYQHSSWLTMMRDRAQLARELLRDDGVIFVSIDDNEAFRAQLMLRDCFGPESFLCGLIAWQKRYSPPPDTDDIGYVHELILTFKATPAFRRNLLPLTEDQKARYVNLDDDPRGPWKPMDYTCRYTADERPNLYYPIQHPTTGEDVWPKKTRVWAFSVAEHKKNVHDDRVWWGKKGTAKVPAYKNFISEIEQGLMPMTLFPYELVGHTDEAAKELRNLFPTAKVNVKPTRLIGHLATIGADSDSLLIDYFAGAGTTGHAVINLNRTDKGHRKYVMVENTDHFEELLLPRIKKIMFAEKWEDGKPKEVNPISHLMKYQHIEQYEDTLNNLEFPRAGDGKIMLSLLKDPYLLTYMLEFETQGSRANVDLDSLKEPFRYKYVLERGGRSEDRYIDLIETFNYLLGLRVSRVRQLKDGDRIYRGVAGLRDGQRIAIIWRNASDLHGDSSALDRDKEIIEKTVLPALWKDDKADRILVNGPCFVTGAESIEPEFKRLMFSVNE
jgi:adenine-specific DNA-methyltransferase